jgi:pyridoxamine 5'-phosphate oxidase
MVYLKELDETGWVIYSNWGTSHKARDFESNKWVSLCFWWKGVERQVRVEGKGERLSDEESQRYFDTRARGSRIGAWASRQSTVLRSRQERSTKGAVHRKEVHVTEEGKEQDDGRSELEEQIREVEDRFQGQERIPVPDFWGGLRVVPEVVEFWQGRDNRLHDRFQYQRPDGAQDGGAGDWKISRLSP